MAFVVRGPGGLLIPEEAAAPAAPPAGMARLYVASDGGIRLLNDAGVDTLLGALTGGSGSSASQGSMFSNDPLGQAVPASRAMAAANGSYFVPIRVPAAATLTGIRYRRGTGTTAANIIAALYNSAGNRVAVSGTIAQGTTASAVLSCPFSAPYSAPAGLYWAMLLGSATGVTFMGWAVNEYLGACAYAAQSSFASPATFTPPSTTTLSTVPVVPWLMTY